MGPDMAITGTLCYIREGGRVLLQLKAASVSKKAWFPQTPWPQSFT